MPRPTCVALNCKNKGGFSFPKDANLRKKWIEAVRRQNFYPNPTKNSVLCSDHFLPCDMTRDGGFLQRRRLKTNAVPSIFSYEPLMESMDDTTGSLNLMAENDKVLSNSSVSPEVDTNFSIAGNIKILPNNRFNLIVEESNTPDLDATESDGYGSDTTTSWASLCEGTSSRIRDSNICTPPNSLSHNLEKSPLADSASDVEVLEEISGTTSQAAESAVESIGNKPIRSQSQTKTQFIQLNDLVRGPVTCITADSLPINNSVNKNYYLLSSNSSGFELKPLNASQSVAKDGTIDSAEKCLVNDLVPVLKGLLPDNWIVSYNDDRLRLVKIEDNIQGLPTVKMSLTLSPGKIVVTVLGKMLPKSHKIFGRGYNGGSFLFTEVLKIINTLLSSKICVGVPCNKINNEDSRILRTVLRAQNCQMIGLGLRCYDCCILHARRQKSERSETVGIRNPEESVGLQNKIVQETVGMNPKSTRSLLENSTTYSRIRPVDVNASAARVPANMPLKLPRLMSIESMDNMSASGLNAPVNMPKLVRYPTVNSDQSERAKQMIRLPRLKAFQRKKLNTRKTALPRPIVKARMPMPKESQPVDEITQANVEPMRVEILIPECPDTHASGSKSTGESLTKVAPQTQDETLRFIGLTRVNTGSCARRKSKRERKPTALLGETINFQKDSNEFIENNLQTLHSLFLENLNFGCYSQMTRLKLLFGCQKTNEILGKWQKLYDAHPDMFLDHSFPCPRENDYQFDALDDNELREHLSTVVSDISLAKIKFKKSFPAFDKWCKENRSAIIINNGEEDGVDKIECPN